MVGKFLFAILAVFTNSLGIPCFLQGRKKTGIVRLVLTFVTFGICGLINSILGILLGIQVMMMSNEDYEEQKYVLDKGIPSARMLGEGGAQKSDGASAPVHTSSSSSASQQSKVKEFNVLINNGGYDENAVLQAIVEIKNCSVEEAVSILGSGIVLQDVSEDVADRAIASLKAAGATVEKEEAYDYDELNADNILGGLE